MLRLYSKLVKRAAAMLYAAQRLNGFVYEACRQVRIRRPDIPVRPVEFYGQLGEDLIVAALVAAKAQREQIDLSTTRYVEIGGNHPFATSATYLLHQKFGMTGLIVEANPALMADLERGRASDTIVHAAVYDKDNATVKFSVSNLSEVSSINRDFVAKWAGGTVGEAALIEVPAVRINKLLYNHIGDEQICFLSIDAEGFDLAILKDLDLSRYRPWFLQMEPSESQLPGSTQFALDYMRANDYWLAARTDWNLIFADSRPHKEAHDTLQSPPPA